MSSNYIALSLFSWNDQYWDALNKANKSANNEAVISLILADRANLRYLIPYMNQR